MNDVSSVVNEAEAEIRKIQEKKERDKTLEDEMKEASSKQPEVVASSGSQQSSVPNPRPATVGSSNGGMIQEQTQQQTLSRPVTAGTKSIDQVSMVSPPCAEMLADSKLLDFNFPKMMIMQNLFRMGFNGKQLYRYSQVYLSLSTERKGCHDQIFVSC